MGYIGKDTDLKIACESCGNPKRYCNCSQINAEAWIKAIIIFLIVVVTVTVI